MHFCLLICRRFSNLIQTHFTPSIHSTIKALVEQGHYSQALISYTRGHNLPLNATKFTFPSLLKACASLSNLCYGKTIHATILAMGLQFDPYIISSLINMYVKCGSLESAVHLFVNVFDCEVLAQDVTIWNSVIDGYFRYGFIEEGLVQFRSMQLLGVKPDGHSLSIILGVCDCNLGYLELKQMHGYIVRNTFDGDPFVATALIDVYSSSGWPNYAWSVFEKLEDKSNVVQWNAMIRGFCQNALWASSLELYSLMKILKCKLVSTTFSSTLTACSQAKNVGIGRQVHCDVIKMDFWDDPYVCTSLLTMYAKCGLVEEAEQVFEQVVDKELELWNAMISGYIGNGCPYDALDVYIEMKSKAIQLDSFTICNILASCAVLGLYDFGRAMHGEMTKRPIHNLSVQSALLTMYSKCERLGDANVIFTTIEEKDVVAWGSLISGYCKNRKFKEALDLFRAMEADRLRPDSDIMVSVTSACVVLQSKALCREVHGFVLKNGLELDPFVASSLIDMYSKFKCPEMAEHVYFSIQHKSLVVGNSMIACYCYNGLPEMAVSLVRQLIDHGFYLDSVSITSLLTAVSSMAALLKGKTIHGYGVRQNILSDIQVQNTLIDMYIKCGCLKYAQHIFQNMSSRNLVTWNSMISGYGSHGDCLTALHLYNEMRRAGVIPDEVTFLSLTSSCNHSGLINEGLNLLQSMKDYGVEPKMEHFVNIVDLLGRAGCLNDAYSVISSMPIDPDRSVWLSLLSACRAHRNVKLGELAAEKLLQIDPTRGSNYVQLLNLYVEAGLGNKAAYLRASMRKKGLKKSPGCSWIEVKAKVDIFFSGDSSSSRTIEIHETLNSLKLNMRKREGDYCEAL